eukprot:2514224-Alexandrium_andersonii.AAC.1
MCPIPTGPPAAPSGASCSPLPRSSRSPGARAGSAHPAPPVSGPRTAGGPLPSASSSPPRPGAREGD